MYIYCIFIINIATRNIVREMWDRTLTKIFWFFQTDKYIFNLGQIYMIIIINIETRNSERNVRTGFDLWGFETWAGEAHPISLSLKCTTTNIFWILDKYICQLRQIYLEMWAGEALPISLSLKCTTTNIFLTLDKYFWSIQTNTFRNLSSLIHVINIFEMHPQNSQSQWLPDIWVHLFWPYK